MPREQPPQKTVHRDPTARSSSVLGPNVVFKGELSAQEDLLIHGRIEGSIEHNAATLTISTRADVKADIVARRIIVQGKVRGDMRASEAVIVETTAEVHGDIFAPRIGLAAGAKFTGRIDMDPAIGVKQGHIAAGLAEPGVDELLRNRTS